MNAYLLKVDGAKIEVTPNNGTDFTLAEMYKLIGCELIEIVYLPNDKIMIVDEEGWLKADPIYNQFASDISGCDIEGNVIVCNDDMVK